ncbi:hypothetical protein [Noviherbaspirillum saxi]|uniref:Uncharacterized protein n=1 Tax=Noviherbaspirillum saxi TaxID=2320863 RepID=A0A3A3G201_9BURK|nr:hypothetical protein [Noviherbaspirillum saxi]RJF92103.1 hypothetical protein D3871_26010 [Noviherbaspirillum saxi]
MQLSAKRVQFSDAKPDVSCLAAIEVLSDVLIGSAHAVSPVAQPNTVAANVGRLAQDYAQAAKKIQTLLKSSIEKSSPQSGMKHYCEPTVDEILSTIQRMKDIMSDMPPASFRQL